MQAKAVWDAERKVYKLYGTKTWISNSPVADVMIVWARSERHDNKIKVPYLHSRFLQFIYFSNAKGSALRIGVRNFFVQLI